MRRMSSLSFLIAMLAAASAWLPISTPMMPPVAAQTEQRILRHEKTREAQRSGRYYALVIGNNDYQYVSALQTATKDARVIEEVLRDEYGFETQLLLNARRDQILTALNEYRRTLDEQANLLIYYAGHGHYDRDVEKAYWIPVDARPDNNVNWISADDVTTNIRGILAAHILIISDSCYSGMMPRGDKLILAPKERERYLQKMIAGKSRILMSSGGNEPVADGGAAGHSVFAAALLTGFKQMGEDRFTAEELFYQYIREPVAGKTHQTPQYNPIINSGHDSGDFVFMRTRATHRAEVNDKPPIEVNSPTGGPPIVLNPKCSTEVIEASGEAILGEGMTMAMADELAYEEALRNAMRQACPAGTASPLAFSNNSMVVNLIQFAKRGIPLNTEVLARQTLSEVVDRNGERITVDRRRVKIRTRFVALAGDSDPDFRVTISGINPSYIEGQEMVVTVTATKDCYVYLFTVAVDQSVTIFFPNRFRRDNLLKAGQSLEFPNAEDRRKGIEFVLEVAKGQGAQTKEWITALAVKHPVDFLSGTQIQEALEKSYRKGDTDLIDRLLERLTGLQSGDLAQDVKEYKVLHKGPQK